MISLTRPTVYTIFLYNVFLIVSFAFESPFLVRHFIMINDILTPDDYQ